MLGAVLYAFALSAVLDRLADRLRDWGDSRSPTRTERAIIERRRASAIAAGRTDAAASARCVQLDAEGECEG